MNLQTIEIEAETLEEARKQIYNERYIVLEEFVVYPGESGIIEAVGDTNKQAFVKARSRVPAEAIVTAETVRAVADQLTLQVSGVDEKLLKKEGRKVITFVSQVKKGRKGFWGFGKTQNVYEIVLTQQAVVEIRYRIPARLRAIVRDYSAKELLYSVQKARNCAEWSEIHNLLNPKNNREMNEKLIRIAELHSVSMFDIIEEICRKNERAGWETVINEAHLKILIQRENEVRKEKIRLRNLDVEIADSFHFFTSIDWYPKGRKEPTGLPKDIYGSHRSTDEKFRRTIPNYSTVEKDYKELERRIKAFGLYELFIQALHAENLDEATATLEQKCIAALTARKLARNKKIAIGKPEEVALPDQNIIARLRDELIRMCLGNREQAEKLINFEKKRHPDLNEQKLLRAAIERLRRDNN